MRTRHAAVIRRAILDVRDPAVVAAPERVHSRDRELYRWVAAREVGKVMERALAKFARDIRRDSITPDEARRRLGLNT